MYDKAGYMTKVIPKYCSNELKWVNLDQLNVQSLKTIQSLIYYLSDLPRKGVDENCDHSSEAFRYNVSDLDVL